MRGKSLIRIAIADDHTIVRKGLVEIVKSFGEFEVVIEANHGQNLIDQMLKTKKLPSICLIDVNMPVKNGYDTAAYIKETWPEVKIVALSMIDVEFTVIKMLRSGCHGFILKNCSEIELRNALNCVYENSYYHSELVTSKLLHALHFENRHDISENEMEFLEYCTSDLSYKEIGKKMNLSSRTVEGYRDALFKKLKINTRIGLAVFALKSGLGTRPK